MHPYLKMTLLILTMAAVTYVIRAVPFAFFRKKIKSCYLCGVLYYIPYAVLSAMTFPYIFYATGNFYAALIGTAVALAAALGAEYFCRCASPSASNHRGLNPISLKSWLIIVR